MQLSTFQKQRDKDPRWRKTAKFTHAELRELIPFNAANKIPADRHMIYALQSFGAMRTGEAVGRRWLDWDESHMPLGQMLVATQYDDMDTKTKRPRLLPVHPALDLMLCEFRDHWWPLLYGRSPSPDDFIVPVRGRGKPRADSGRRCRTKHDVYNQLQRDLNSLGIRPRRAHDFRRTLISFAQDAGCNRAALKDITHGAKGDIISDYTTFDWQTLCSVISSVQVDLASRSAQQIVRVMPKLSGPFASKADVVRQFDLATPVDEVVQHASTWSITRFDVYTTRRLMRLEQADGVSRSRFGASLTPFEKALPSDAPSDWNRSTNLATPTGIEPVLPT